MNRKIFAFQITDDEMDSLESFDLVINLSLSAVAFCLSMIFAAVWDIGFSPASREGDSFFKEWFVFWIVLLVGSSVVAVLVWRKRKTLTRKIRQSSGG